MGPRAAAGVAGVPNRCATLYGCAHRQRHLFKMGIERFAPTVRDNDEITKAAWLKVNPCDSAFIDGQ